MSNTEEQDLSFQTSSRAGADIEADREALRVLVHDLHARLGTIRLAMSIPMEARPPSAEAEVTRLAFGLDAVSALARAFPPGTGNGDLTELARDAAADASMRGTLIEVAGDEVVAAPTDAEKFRRLLAALFGFVAGDSPLRVVVEGNGNKAVIRISGPHELEASSAVRAMAAGLGGRAEIEDGCLVVELEESR